MSGDVHSESLGEAALILQSLGQALSALNDDEDFHFETPRIGLTSTSSRAYYHNDALDFDQAYGTSAASSSRTQESSIPAASAASQESSIAAEMWRAELQDDDRASICDTTASLTPTRLASRDLHRQGEPPLKLLPLQNLRECETLSATTQKSSSSGCDFIRPKLHNHKLDIEDRHQELNEVRSQLRRAVSDLAQSRALLEERDTELGKVQKHHRNAVNELGRVRESLANPEEELRQRNLELSQCQAHHAAELQRASDENAEVQKALQSREEELARIQSQQQHQLQDTAIQDLQKMCGAQFEDVSGQLDEVRSMLLRKDVELAPSHQRQHETEKQRTQHEECTADELMQVREQLWQKEQELVELTVKFDYTSAELQQARLLLRSQEDELRESLAQTKDLLQRRDDELVELTQQLGSTKGTLAEVLGVSCRSSLVQERPSGQDSKRGSQIRFMDQASEHEKKVSELTATLEQQRKASADELAAASARIADLEAELESEVLSGREAASTADTATGSFVVESRRWVRTTQRWAAQQEGQCAVDEGVLVFVRTDSCTKQGWIYVESSQDTRVRPGWLPDFCLDQA